MTDSKFFFKKVKNHYSSSVNLFSKSEMLQVLEDMESEMRDTFKAELEMFYRMSGVMM